MPFSCLLILFSVYFSLAPSKPSTSCLSSHSILSVTLDIPSSSSFWKKTFWRALTLSLRTGCPLEHRFLGSLHFSTILYPLCSYLRSFVFFFLGLFPHFSDACLQANLLVFVYLKIPGFPLPSWKDFPSYVPFSPNFQSG